MLSQTPWSRVLGKLIIAQLVKIFFVAYGTVSAIGPFFEADESSLYTYTIFPKDPS